MPTCQICNKEVNGINNLIDYFYVIVGGFGCKKVCGDAECFDNADELKE